MFLLRMMILKFCGILIFLQTIIFQPEGLIIVFIDKNAKTFWIIDIAVPTDCRVTDKEIEKIDKYQDLWNMRSVVIPVVVGASGVVSTAFKHHTSILNLPNWLTPLIQKAALLGTAKILRWTLQLSGFG